MSLSKTAFMRGMQCPKMLWLDKHKPSAKVIPHQVQERLDAGNDFGDRAMGMFGPFVEMTTFLPGTTYPDKETMARLTQEHIAAGTPVICEAAFLFNGHYCAVDILRKTETGYDFYEVKNMPELKDQLVKDAGFQYYIIKNSGLDIGRIFIILHGDDQEFLPVDVTGDAKGFYSWVDENIGRLDAVACQKEEMTVNWGEQCEHPYRCWYYDYCHAVGEQMAIF